MVKLARLFVIIHTAVLATACGTKSSGDDGVFRVALLTPGPISDQAWNSSAYKGLERVRDSLGAEISHIQTKTPAEFEENFRQYGAKGFDLVIGHGFEFQDAAQRVGPEYPKTVYVTTGGSGTGPNIAALSFAFDEPSFFAGIAAASVSQNGVMAVLGGTELPPVKSSFAAFEAGARSVRPDIQVLTAFIGNWDDAAAGKEQALALMSRRADVIFQNADAAGLGAFQAVRERGKAWIIGANADQNQVAPEVTLGSVVIDLPHAFLLVAREVKDGTFTPRVVRLDTKSEVVRWVPNPSVQILSKVVTDHIDTLRAQLVSGTFTLPAPSTP
ncbi:MAG: BMP family protein [Gemmatimonadaceae bacterium]